MEVLGGLCTVEENGEMVRECVEPEAYDELARLLVLQDPLLLQALLDTLYQLSELGEPPCTRIAHSPHSIGENFWRGVGKQRVTLHCVTQFHRIVSLTIMSSCFSTQIA